MLQLSSDIKIEPEAKEALGYLINQFPSEYVNQDDVKASKPKPPTEAEKEESEKKELMNYSEQVAKDASDYAMKIKKEAEDKQEAKHFDGLDEEAMVQLKGQAKLDSHHK